MPLKVSVGVIIDGSKITLELPDEAMEIFRALARAQGRSLPIVASSDRELPQSERQMIAEKKPRSHSETVAVLALCLRENGTNEFAPEEMRRAYIRAGVRPPKVVAQALRDAKNKYEFIEPGSRAGTFRLSAHGERTVIFDLPHAD